MSDLLNPYCTVQQVRDYIRNTDATIEDQLIDAINGASRYIDRYKGRDYFEHAFDSETPLVIDRFDGAVMESRARPNFFEQGLNPFNRRSILQLRWRVIEITSVTIAGVVWAVDLEYRVRAEEGVLIAIEHNWPEAVLEDDCISIVGRFGYPQRDPEEEDAELDTTLVPVGMPEEIKAAAVQIAAALSRQNFKDVVGLDGTKASLLDTAIPKSATLLLGSQKLLV